MARLEGVGRFLVAPSTLAPLSLGGRSNMGALLAALCPERAETAFLGLDFLGLPASGDPSGRQKPLPQDHHVACGTTRDLARGENRLEPGDGSADERSDSTFPHLVIKNGTADLLLSGPASPRRLRRAAGPSPSRLPSVDKLCGYRR